MATSKARKARGTSRSETLSKVHGAGRTDIGHNRSTNQDVIVVEPALGLYAVLDGIGGHKAGDVAARLAAAWIVEYVRKAGARRREPGRILQDALRDASSTVFGASMERAEYQGMGTTAVACLITDERRAAIAHMGDSRAYLLRDGELAALTDDHAGAEPNTITRYLGRSVDADVREHDLRPGDRLLLCSDGLHGYTPARSIRRTLAANAVPAQLADRLVALALRQPSRDNISAVVIDIARGPIQPLTRPRPRSSKTAVKDLAGRQPPRRAALATPRQR